MPYAECRNLGDITSLLIYVKGRIGDAAEQDTKRVLGCQEVDNGTVAGDTLHLGQLHQDDRAGKLGVVEQCCRKVCIAGCAVFCLIAALLAREFRTGRNKVGLDIQTHV